MIHSPRVVTIDDDPHVCELVQAILAEEGYPTECYPDGPTALARIADGGVVLVLLDWMLPGMSGAEVLERILTGPAPIPTVIVTAVGAEFLPEPPLGAITVLRKPFELDDLLALVGEHAPGRGQ
jgi:two-component system C4-dicarboxylate transport response regulator DctD